MSKKLENHPYSEKSKYPCMKESLDAKAVKGDCVYLKSEGDKHNLRNKYLVLDSDEHEASIAKLLHSLDENSQTKLSSKVRRVKQTDIYQATKNRHATVKHKNVHTENKEGDDRKRQQDEKTQGPTPLLTWSPFLEASESSDDDENIVSVHHNIDYPNEPDGNCEIEPEEIQNLSQFDANNADNYENILTTVVMEEPRYQPNYSAQPQFSLSQEADASDSTYHDHSSVTVSDKVNTEESLEIQEETPPTLDDLFDPAKPNPQTLPLAGDKISFIDYDAQPPTVVHATIATMYKTVQRKHPGWFNIIRVDGHETPGSIRLDDRRWRFYEDQGDNNRILDETVGHDQGHNRAFNAESPENEQLPIPFPEVLNLEHVLPLTSTPASSNTRIYHRLSAVRPRGLLPMEIEDSPLSSPSKSRFKKAMHDGAKHLKKVLSMEEKNSSNSSEGDSDEKRGGGER